MARILVENQPRRNGGRVTTAAAPAPLARRTVIARPAASTGSGRLNEPDRANQPARSGRYAQHGSRPGTAWRKNVRHRPGNTSAAPVTPASPAWPAGLRLRLGRAVDQLLDDASPRFLADHCRRSFRLAMLIATAQHGEIDVEVVYAGVMLHDLGLTARYHSPAVRFGVACANAARDFALRDGLSAQ
jgi:hypothetical protein